jgi:hypothetical protein
MTENKFKELHALDVSSKVEKKNGLTYLSWAWAWGEFVKVYPTATYEVIKNPQGLPYFADDSGAIVYTKVTAGGVTQEMWLPVMDGANKSMKTTSYQYKTKYDTKTVDAYTMFDINKTVMRCLVKNLAMFGLGLYIYAGEDLPENEDDKPVVKKDEKMTPFNGDKQGLTSGKIKTKIADIKKALNASSNLEELGKAWVASKPDIEIVRKFDEEYFFDIEHFKNELKESLSKLIDDDVPDFINN